MSSKEMLGHLQDMKIPAKSFSSTLEDAYVSIVRKKLKPILEARAAEIEAQKKAEAEAKAEEERKEAEKAERERIEAEKRREKERAEEERKRAAAEAARKKAEEERKEAERKRKEEEERNRVRDTAPKSIPSFTSLLDQIAQQEKVLEEQAAEAAKKKEEDHAARDHGKGRGRRSDRPSRGGEAEETHRGGRRSSTPRVGASVPGPVPEGESEGRGRGKGRKGGRRGHEDEDRYSRMAREAEEYNRSHVFEEAREAVEEAHQDTGRRRKRKERRKKQQAEAAEEQRIQEAIENDHDLSQLDTVKVPQGSTVADLAKLLNVPANDIIKRLFLLGNPLTLTESMSDDLIELVADDLGRDVKVMTKEEENSFSFYDDPKDLKPPPARGHGHGPRRPRQDVPARRDSPHRRRGGRGRRHHAGHRRLAGADQREDHHLHRHPRPRDFHGHACPRRQGDRHRHPDRRGRRRRDAPRPSSRSTTPRLQTCPIIVAVNKIDKPGADPTRVRQELTEYGIIPEEWGGQNMFVDISAKKHMGIEDLLEAVLLEADVLELKANPDTFASGHVLEAKLDRGRGSVATLLVSRGTLHVGDAIVAGMAFGKIRAMMDPRGRNVKEARPSDPVEVLGLQSVPMAGDEFRVFQDERDARALADERALKARIEEQNKVKHVTLENLFDTMADADVKELNLIIKADVQGSIEALVDSLNKMDQSEVRINVIHSAVGAINETDVTLADASNAIIIGFGVRPDAKARAQAEQQGVEIRCYSVIYKAIEEIDAARIGMLKPTEQEVQTASVEVRNTFKVPKVGIAAGCMVQEGEVSRDDLCRLVRDGIVVYEGKLASLRRYKDDVKSVKAGFECGIGLDNFQDIHVGDIIETYRIEQVARTE